MADKKKTRKSITLDTKLTMIKMSNEGVSQANIGRRLGFTRTTVNTVMKNKEKFLAEARSATPVTTTTIRKRHNIVADVERHLILWIDEQTVHNVPITQAIIQNKALNIFNELKAEKGEAAKDAEFVASRGWFDRFKKRCILHNIKAQCMAEYDEGIEDFQLDGVNGNEECVGDRISNEGETELLWGKARRIPNYKGAKKKATPSLLSSAPADIKSNSESQTKTESDHSTIEDISSDHLYMKPFHQRLSRPISNNIGTEYASVEVKVEPEFSLTHEVMPSKVSGWQIDSFLEYVANQLLEIGDEHSLQVAMCKVSEILDDAKSGLYKQS